MTLYNKAGDAELGELHGEGQAVEAATNDENGGADHHDAAPLTGKYFSYFKFLATINIRRSRFYELLNDRLRKQLTLRPNSLQNPMMARRRNKAAMTRTAWRLMFDYLMATSPRRTESLSRRHLTPNDARALWSLEPGEGRPIGTLAKDWNCDPSNATFIIDRLVRAGLAERRDSPADRRVKLVALSEAGARARQELREEYLKPPAAFAALSGEDLEQLLRILAKLALPSNSASRR
jgi:DNA-binding MarR family transcriptional regulator